MLIEKLIFAKAKVASTRARTTQVLATFARVTFCRQNPAFVNKLVRRPNWPGFYLSCTKFFAYSMYMFI